MSSMSSIDFIINDNPKKVTALDIIHHLTKSGWHIGYEGSVVYLPHGDKEEYNWRSVEKDKSDLVFKEVQGKIDDHEKIGLNFSHSEKNTGFDLLIDPDLNVISCILDNPLQINSTPLTDFNWYLVSVGQTIHELGLSIESLSCNQS